MTRSLRAILTDNPYDLMQNFDADLARHGLTFDVRPVFDTCRNIRAGSAHLSDDFRAVWSLASRRYCTTEAEAMSDNPYPVPEPDPGPDPFPMPGPYPDPEPLPFRRSQGDVGAMLGLPAYPASLSPWMFGKRYGLTLVDSLLFSR